MNIQGVNHHSVQSGSLCSFRVMCLTVWCSSSLLAVAITYTAECGKPAENRRRVLEVERCSCSKVSLCQIVGFSFYLNNFKNNWKTFFLLLFQVGTVSFHLVLFSLCCTHCQCEKQMTKKTILAVSWGARGVTQPSPCDSWESRQLTPLTLSRYVKWMNERRQYISHLFLISHFKTSSLEFSLCANKQHLQNETS